MLDVETAFDLTAETFAAALRSVPRYEPAETPAVEAVAGLPEGQRAAVVARHLEGESYAEIAERLECSPSVVRQRVSRGLRTVRAQLEWDR